MGIMVLDYINPNLDYEKIQRTLKEEKYIVQKKNKKVVTFSKSIVGIQIASKLKHFNPKIIIINYKAAVFLDK